MDNNSHSHNHKHFDDFNNETMINIALKNVERILQTFNVEYVYNKQKQVITGCCPIHSGSDNNHALHLRSDSGFWRCYTRGCEKVFGKSILGLVKGLISTRQHNWDGEPENVCKFSEVAKFLEKFSNGKTPKFKKECDKLKFTQYINRTMVNNVGKILQISKEALNSSLSIPSEYFIKRGFLPETLKYYSVGNCLNSSKEMKDRAVVPIFDNNHKYMVGCVGRSIYNQCLICGFYHNPNRKCPQNYYYQYSKWLNSYGFIKTNILYNYWFAKEHILNTGTIVLVESPGNIWKLYEAGINNAVAILGCDLSRKQLDLIHRSGAIKIVLLLDNDEAGYNAQEYICKKLGGLYNIVMPEFNSNDVAELTLEEIKRCLS